MNNNIANPSHPLNPLNPLSPTNPNGIYYTQEEDDDWGDIHLTKNECIGFIGVILAFAIILWLLMREL